MKMCQINDIIKKENKKENPEDVFFFDNSKHNKDAFDKWCNYHGICKMNYIGPSVGCLFSDLNELKTHYSNLFPL
jgi:hypothetical protein